MSDNSPNDISAPLEALLLMATEPMSTQDLATAVDEPEHVVVEALHQLQQFYQETKRGFQLRNIAGGWRYYTHPDYYDLIAEWVVADSQARLSQAALETLAVIAYNQPVSRSRVSAVRGVNVDGVVRTLTTRGLVDIAGNDPETGAALLITTPYFLERMGINTLDELPPLAPHLPDAVELEAELVELQAAEENTNSAEPANEDDYDPRTQ